MDLKYSVRFKFTFVFSEATFRRFFGICFKKFRNILGKTSMLEPLINKVAGLKGNN